MGKVKAARPVYVAPSGRPTKLEAMWAFARQVGRGVVEDADGEPQLDGGTRRYRLELVRTAAGWAWAVFREGEGE